MSEFKEYEEWEASLDQKYLKQLSPDAFELSPAAFYAGQQSQQAKIDLLEVQLKGAEERAKLTLDHKNKMVDELQARVDEALTLIYKEKSKVECDVYKGLDADLIIGVGYELHLILKGNKDEN